MNAQLLELAAQLERHAAAMLRAHERRQAGETRVPDDDEDAEDAEDVEEDLDGGDEGNVRRRNEEDDADTAGDDRDEWRSIGAVWDECTRIVKIPSGFKKSAIFLFTMMDLRAVVDALCAKVPPNGNQPDPKPVCSWFYICTCAAFSNIFILMMNLCRWTAVATMMMMVAGPRTPTLMGAMMTAVGWRQP